MLDFLKSESNHEESGYEAVPVDSELVEQYQESRPGRQAIRVVPSCDNGGIEAMDSVLESLHTVRTESGRFQRKSKNVSPAHAAEFRYGPIGTSGDSVVSLQYIPGNDRLDGTFERQLKQHYSDSELTRSKPDFLPIEAGDYLAGATLKLRRYCLYPLKSIDHPGFDTDPSGSIIQEMAGDTGPGKADVSVAVQVMFKPAPDTWTNGVPNGRGVGDIDDSKFLRTSSPSLQQLASDFRQPTLEERRRLFTWETVEHPPSKVDKQIATLLENQRGNKAWHLCIRIFACSSDPNIAIRRASQTAGQHRRFYEHRCGQSFLPQPLTGPELQSEFIDAVSREFSTTGMVKSQRQVAGLCNIPKAEFVNTTDMQWSLSGSGRGIPPRTPRFSFSENGVAQADEAEQQVSMLDMTGADEPYWFGWGSKDGTEAGVFPDVLNTHQFVGGSTGQGKTTLLKHLSRQLMNRNHGCLIYDPKGMDAEDIVSLVPDHREKDLIYLEVGGDRDRSVGFNFLEPPTDAEPGEQIFVDAIESMTDDIAALLAQSSGGQHQDYWGPRMDQIARNLVRGMAQAGHRCTLLDMYLALLDESGRDEYARMLEDDDRLEWLQTYAERELADMSQDDIRPVLGRLKELVENRTTREIISHPESTVSIRDAVRDGKILVVRDVASQENAGRLVATALVRRIWVAVRELTLSENTEDPPEFYCVLDEFDDIAATSSNIAQILSNARSFGLSISACCQDMSSQLDDQILNAIEGQCQTFLSFNPGRSGDAKIIAKQHSPDIDDEDLLNLSKYTFYMRTHDRENELTHSYKVDAFPPLEEISDVARSGDETEGLIQDSLETYGAPRRSDETRKTESVFWSGADSVGWERITTETEERAVSQGTYDTAIRSEGTSGWVEIDACYDAILRRLERLDSTPDELSDIVQDSGDLWRRCVQHVRDEWLDVDGDRIRCPNPRSAIANVSTAKSEGSIEHSGLMWDAYSGLCGAGVGITINTTGGATADAVGYPHPDPDYPDIVEALTLGKETRIEAEHQTTTKPGQTVRHLNQAIAEDRAIIYLCRPENESTVRNVLLASPHGCRETPDGRMRFYTSPRTVHIDGDEITRPGEAENCWYQTPSGEIVLEDGNGKTWARFEDADSITTDASAYPASGSVPVKRPVIPAFEGKPDVSIVVVSEGATGLDDLRIVGGVAKVEVPDRVDPLYDLLHEHTKPGETFTRDDAVAIAAGNGLDRHYTTIYDYVNELVGIGALTPRGETANGAELLALL